MKAAKLALGYIAVEPGMSERKMKVLSAFYPSCETTKQIVITSSIAGGLLYLLLIIYQPFGTSQFEDPNKYLLLFPYAIISTFAFCTINLIVKRRNNKNWSVGLELVKMLAIFLVISIMSYFYNTLFVSKVSLSFENFLYMFWYTCALGSPVAALYVLGRYIYLNRGVKPALNGISLNEGDALPDNTFDAPETNLRLRIVADYNNYECEIEQDDFIYAEAVDNYCFIHYHKNASSQKEIIRISLTKLLTQIETDAIKRVHRSFIVNLKKVSKYKGNASGYKIWLENETRELMISRSYIDSIVPVLKTFVVRP